MSRLMYMFKTYKKEINDDIAKVHRCQCGGGISVTYGDSLNIKISNDKNRL